MDNKDAYALKNAGRAAKWSFIGILNPFFGWGFTILCTIHLWQLSSTYAEIKEISQVRLAGLVVTTFAAFCYLSTGAFLIQADAEKRLYDCIQSFEQNNREIAALNSRYASMSSQPVQFIKQRDGETECKKDIDTALFGIENSYSAALKDAKQRCYSFSNLNQNNEDSIAACNAELTL